MRRTSTGLAVLVLGLTISSAALGTPEMQGQFSSTCKPKPGSPLATAMCTTCHVKMGDKKLNLFGTDVKTELGKQKSKAFTAAVWKKLAALDSNRNGVKNGAEVAAGKLPGSPKSKS